MYATSSRSPIEISRILLGLEYDLRTSRREVAELKHELLRMRTTSVGSGQEGELRREILENGLKRSNDLCYELVLSAFH
jgi:hypothetical protein